MENNQLMEKENGIIRTIKNLLEIIRSKVDKKYILSINSPESLKRDIKLTKRTLEVDPEYFSIIPTDLFLDEETNEYVLKEEGLLYWAFDNGIELENIFGSLKEREDFSRIYSLYLEFKVQSGQEISNDYLEKLPSQLLMDKRVRDILFPKLLQNTTNLEKLFEVLNGQGMRNYEIFDILSDSAKKTISSNPQLFEKLLEYSNGQELQIIINKFYTKDELKQLFDREDLPETIQRLGELYKNDSQILRDLNPKMLSKNYQKIPLYKIQLISRIPELQETVLSLKEFELNLYIRMSNSISSKTNNWQEFENNILMNLKKGSYSQLLENMQESARLGNKISHDELEKLTNLFSGYSVNFEQGNIFGITTREELQQFENIRDEACDAILKNPQMDDEMLISPISKYTANFRSLSEIDRVKMAILEKYYNLSINEAMSLVKTFGQGIEDIRVEDVGAEVTIEKIKDIKAICGCEDIGELYEMNNSNRTSIALSQSVELRQDARGIYEKLYQDSLYQINEKDRGEDTVYNGVKIHTYYPGTNFSMIAKRVSTLDGVDLRASIQGINMETYKEAWEDSGRKVRFKTSTSYMTPENLMLLSDGIGVYRPQIILGFSNGIGSEFSIDEMYSTDEATPCVAGDKLFREAQNSNYQVPTTLEACTGVNEMYSKFLYNELVINTVSQDENGNSIKMQPSYIVYIQENFQEDKENNVLWVESQKAAQQFGVPIVVLDREKIQQHEREQIVEGCKSKDANDDKMLMSKIWHYINRYGQENLINDVPSKIMDQVIQYNISPMQHHINSISKVSKKPIEEQLLEGEEQEV